jgi:outer membrane protein OmpA-like peptidoglycan-associated protein
VRAHSGGATDRALGDLGAQAYATGNDIALPSSPSVHLVAHELAHVAQQRQGVSLKGGVGAAGDAYEVEADAIADRVATGQSAADLMPATSGGGGSAAVQLKADPQITTKMNIKLVGHASPKWEKTHGKDKKMLNKNLSRDRAATVEEVLRVLLSEHLAARGHATHVAVASTAVDHDDGSIEIETDSRGSEDTVKEAGGDEKSNAESLRRVNVKVTLGWHVRNSGEAMSTVAEDVPEHCDPDATDDWGVILSLSGGAGHAGVGGAFAFGKLKNNRTGKTAPGAFVGGGIGVGLASPGFDFGEDYTNFKTDRPVTFRDFEHTLARLTQVGGGIGIISGSVTYLSFPTLGANSINLSGIGMGALGFDASTNVGDFFFTDTIPGPDCTPAHTVYHDVVEVTPVEYERTKDFEHTVLFDTQSSTLSEAELAVLDSFAIGVAEEYDWDGT